MQGGSFAPDRPQTSSELILKSQLRAQVRFGIHLWASDLLLAMTNSCRSEGAHSQQACKTGQLPQPLASVLHAGNAHICSPGLSLSFKFIYRNCILYILTQMISKVTCPKQKWCSYSLYLLLWSSLSLQMAFPSFQELRLKP